MARSTKLLNCPSCGEQMKVAAGQREDKVCCPHCRQKVTLKSVFALGTSEEAKGTEVLEVGQPESLPAASSLLNEILQHCESKRVHLAETQQDLQTLEAQVRAIGEWLRGLKIQPDDSRSIYAQVDLQYRLFDQLKSLKTFCVEMIDCDHVNDKSLAKSVARTFGAFGWEISLTSGDLEPHCGEEISFIVAPGPVTHSVAGLYFALINSGLRLHSRIALDRPMEQPLLCIHRVSNIPRLLPTPKSKHSGHSPGLRKSA